MPIYDIMNGIYNYNHANMAVLDYMLKVRLVIYYGGKTNKCMTMDF